MKLMHAQQPIIIYLAVEERHKVGVVYMLDEFPRICVVHTLQKSPFVSLSLSNFAQGTFEISIAAPH